MVSRRARFLSTTGGIRAVSINGIGFVTEAAMRHNLQDEMAVRLGEALLGGALLASAMKKGERVNLQIKGSGLCRDAVVDADPMGTVRGYARQNGSPDSKSMGPWGEGVLSVLRTKVAERGQRQPYHGSVPLLTGHFSKDLTFYWHQSEQVPTAVGIQVEAKGSKILKAAAILVQALPSADPVEVERAEKALLSDAQWAKGGADADPAAYLRSIFQLESYNRLETLDLRFDCHCSKERVMGALLLVGPEQVRPDEANKNLSVTCDFCGETYEVTPAEINDLLAKRGSGSD